MSFRNLSGDVQIDHDRRARAIRSLANELQYRAAFGLLEGKQRVLACAEARKQRLPLEHTMLSPMPARVGLQQLLTKCDGPFRASVDPRVQMVLHHLSEAAALTETVVAQLLETEVLHVDGTDRQLSDVARLLGEFVLGRGAFERVDYSVRAQLVQLAETRFTHIADAKHATDEIAQKALEHAELRVRREETFLHDVDDDVLTSVLAYLAPRDARNLMLTCKRFNQSEAVAERRPHYRLRQIDGTLPHRRVGERDFVVANRAIRLYIDFGYKSPQQKIVGVRGPPRDPATWSKRPPEQLQASQKRKEARWRLAEGPTAEAWDGFVRCAFVSPLTHFRAELVYADTHEPVPSVHEFGLATTLSVKKEGGVFFAPKPSRAGFLPASAKVTVTNDIYYRSPLQIRVAIFEPKVENGFAYVYSRPFELISKLAVADNAAAAAASKKRKRELQF